MWNTIPRQRTGAVGDMLACPLRIRFTHRNNIGCREGHVIDCTHRMSKTIRIGAGSAWWGDRIEPAALNAERGDLDYLCFETMAEATVSAAQVRKRRDPSFPGYDTYLDDRMRAVLPALPRRGTKIVTNQGWINPEGAARAHRALAARARRARRQGRRRLGQPDHRPRARADRHDPRERPADRDAGAEPGLGRGLSRRRADRRGAAQQGAQHRRHRPRRRSVDLHGADDVRVRLGRARPSAARARQRHRPPAGMRRAGDRRLLRRPGLQGRARAVEPGLPDRRGRRRRQRRDHQGRRHRRRREPA